MKHTSVVIMFVSLVICPIHLAADTIILKNGRQIGATKCWDDGDLIKCKQYGAVVGYKKGDVEQVVPKPKTKNEKVSSNKKPISIDEYRIEIAYEIQKMWKYDPDLSKASKNEVAAIAFNVLPNGEITDIVFDGLSGDPHLDESAIAAVAKASPVQPHPPEISQPQIKMIIKFTPKGIQW